MTGYAYGTSRCIGCGGLFTYNPMRVPSIRVHGQRQPICHPCVKAANPKRVKNGLAPIQVAPDAYDACREEELF